MWGSSYLLFWFWRHNVFRLEPACQQNKTQIPDLHSGTNCIYIAAEPCSARICWKSSSEMLSQGRFFTGCCFPEQLQVQSWALPQFHNSGRNLCAPCSFLFIFQASSLNLSPDGRSWGGSLPPTVSLLGKDAPCRKLFAFNQQRSERRYLTEWKKYKAEPQLSIFKG